MGATSTAASEAMIDRAILARITLNPRGKDAQAAFRELVQRHQRRATAVAYGIVRNSDDAREIAQDAFMRVWKHVEDFGDQASFGTWLYRIVFNLSIDRTRRRKAEFRACDAIDGCGGDPSESVDVACEALSPLDVVEAREEYARAHAALGTLSPAHQAVIIGRINGKAYAEIAAAQAVPKGTVMSRLFHARRMFAGVLAGGGVVEVEPHLAGPGEDRRLAGELRRQDHAVVADLAGLEVLEGA